MSPDNAWESAGDVLAAARNGGFEITDWQLGRWHRADLLPEPIQEHVLGSAGSKTIYPKGTTNQLLAICQIIQVFPHSLQRCGETLWWRGFPVGKQYWRNVLEERAVWYDEYLSKGFLKSTDGRDERLESLRTSRTSDKTFRQIRNRLRSRYFATFIELLAQVLRGDFDKWTNYISDDSSADKLALDKAMGLGRARDETEVSRRPRLYDDFEGVFELMSGRLGGTKLIDVYKDLSDERILQTRNEIRLFFLIAQIAVVKQRNPSLQRLGLETLVNLSTQASFRTGQLMLLFLAALGEDRAFQENVDRVIEDFRKGAQRDLTDEKIQYLKVRDPALAAIVFS